MEEKEGGGRRRETNFEEEARESEEGTGRGKRAHAYAGGCKKGGLNRELNGQRTQVAGYGGKERVVAAQVCAAFRVSGSRMLSGM